MGEWGHWAMTVAAWRVTTVIKVKCHGFSGMRPLSQRGTRPMVQYMKSTHGSVPFKDFPACHHWVKRAMLLGRYYIANYTEHPKW